MKTSKEEAEAFLVRHSDMRWYHRIELADGVFTPCNHVLPSDTVETNSWLGTWAAIEAKMRSMDLGLKRVLDTGCRDGKFSYLAEGLGATSVLGVDNDILPITPELTKLLQSKVAFKERNIYNIGDASFDVILCFGVLYHLRFPFYALKKLTDCLHPGGTLLIETGIMQDRNSLPLLYCPVEGSPYEPTSCSFFNYSGLSETLKPMGMEEVWMNEIGFATGGKVSITRALMEFKKTGDPMFEDYWYGTHKRYTNHPYDVAKV